MEAYMKLMGRKVRDKVTGLQGVVTAVSFDLYGCVQCIVNPGVQPDGKPGDLCWFDHKRLIVTQEEPVMPLPVYASPGRENGPEAKPLPPAHG